jgi:hypothetical protein
VEILKRQLEERSGVAGGLSSSLFFFKFSAKCQNMMMKGLKASHVATTK